tara:strand:+ start:2310 stop:2672 length:363 start_codon:yes stop_codon:yes gene_type:complete
MFHGRTPAYAAYWLGGMVMPSILDMSWPAIGSTGGDVGAGAGAGAGRAGRVAEVFGTAVGPDTAVGGAGIGSGMADGAASTGATVEAAGAAWASTGCGSAAGWQADRPTAAMAERTRILM